MNSDYVQNLRYKLQKRVRRLNSASLPLLHRGLKLFWRFLEEHMAFKGIMDELGRRHPEAEAAVAKMLTSNEAAMGESELEQAAFSYFVLRHCVSVVDEEIEWQIGHRFSHGGGVEKGLDRFR